MSDAPSPQPSSAAKTRLPVILVTGFLGAGKTTLIRNMLENAQGRRIALIINEFGDVGVDGEILRSCGVDSCRDEDVIVSESGVTIVRKVAS